jgi:serine/threonine protein kinase
LGNKQRTAKAGKSLGRYRIERELGRGGMGVVYLAVDENLGRRIALKTTSMASMGSSEQARNQRQARFLREVKALGQVSHENVVHVFDAGESDDPELGWLLYYSMQFVDGITLAQMVHKLGALEPGAAAAVCMQVGAGLGAAHKEGIVHRDVKPANIFIAKTGRALIGDFGICKLEGSTQITRRDQLVGTPNYLAPEQILGEDITPATDVFALGALFYVIATNSPLRTRVDPASLLKEAQTDDPKKKVMDQARIQPDALRKIVARAVSRDPKKRFPTCAEFADALADFATRVPSFADVTDDNMQLPKQPVVGVDTTSTNSFAPMSGSDPDTPLDFGDAGASAPEPFDFAGSGAAGVEEAALALLKDAGITDDKPKKKQKKETPAPIKEPGSGADLPVARTESTVMFNLRKMEDEEAEKSEPAPAAAPAKPSSSGAELPVARAESTVMFNLRQLEDEEKGKDAPSSSGAQAALDEHTDQINRALDEHTDQIDRPLPPEREEPAAAPQPAVKTVDAQAVQRRVARQIDLPPPALYGAAATVGLVGGLFMLLLMGLVFGDDAAASPPPEDVVIEPATIVTEAAPPPEAPASCKRKAKNKKAAKVAETAVDVAKTLLEQNQRRDAAGKIKEALKKDPRNIDALMLKAKMAAENGQVETALEAYQCVQFYASDTEQGRAATRALQQFEAIAK